MRPIDPKSSDYINDFNKFSSLQIYNLLIDKVQKLYIFIYINIDSSLVHWHIHISLSEVLKISQIKYY